MSSTKEHYYEAGKAEGRAEEKAGTMADTVKEKAIMSAKETVAAKTEEVKERAGDAAEAAKEKTYEGKEKTKGVLAETGDKVKQTIGMGEHDDDQATTAGTGEQRETQEERQEVSLDPEEPVKNMEVFNIITSV
ncbi:unnamed protein product [Linum tenue]|uniref:Uncharacterized protein n=1 Tax=Linum tenue TaxID=586396 RepID=A0AAV0S6G7_9ROSI|nr:unnamed protein product [Linum tenue]